MCYIFNFQQKKKRSLVYSFGVAWGYLLPPASSQASIYLGLQQTFAPTIIPDPEAHAFGRLLQKMASSYWMLDSDVGE